MTKRSETSGSSKPTPSAPKKPASATPATPVGPKTTAKSARPLREYKSRAERETQIQRMIILGSIAAGALIILILVAAGIYEAVILPAQPVASVDGQNISVSDFKTRVRLERALLNNRLTAAYQTAGAFGANSDQYLQYILGQEPYKTWLNEVQVADQLGNRVLNDMVDDVIVRQQAQKMGITASADDIQNQINQFFGYDPKAVADQLNATATVEPSATPTPFVSPTPTVTPTVTPTPAAQPTATASPFPSVTPAPTLNATQRADQYNTNKTSTFQTFKDTARVSDADINAYFETQALRTKLSEQVGATAAAAQTYDVKVRHILVATEDEANDVLAALKGGASFADLAASVSTDTGSQSTGGLYDWAPASNYVAEFANAARTGKIGDFLGPIKTTYGFHVMQVIGRRPSVATDTEKQTAEQKALTTWLKDLRDSGKVAVSTYDVWTNNIPSDPAFVPPQ